MLSDCDLLLSTQVLIVLAAAAVAGDETGRDIDGVYLYLLHGLSHCGPQVLPTVSTTQTKHSLNSYKLMANQTCHIFRIAIRISDL